MSAASYLSLKRELTMSHDDLIARLRGVDTDCGGNAFIPASLLHEAADRIEAQTKRIAELEAFIAGDCVCPCCAQVSACSEDCTFATDAPNDFERVSAARAALTPKESSND